MTKRAMWKAAMVSATVLALPSIAISASSASTEPKPDLAGSAPIESTTDTGSASTGPKADLIGSARSESKPDLTGNTGTEPKPDSTGDTGAEPAADGAGNPGTEPKPDLAASAADQKTARETGAIAGLPTHTKEQAFSNATLKNRATNQCMTVAGSGSSVAVVQRDCMPFASSQRWSAHRLYGYNDVYQIRSNNGFCAEAYANIRTTGAAITASPCDPYGLAKQRWRLRIPGTNTVTLQLAGTGNQCAEVFTNNNTLAAAGRPVTHRGCEQTTNAPEIRWQIG